MNFRKIAVTLAAVTLATACGRGNQEYVEAIPEVEGLTLEVTGDAAEGASTQLRPMDGLATSTSAVTTNSEFLNQARDGVRAVNAAVREVVANVREIAEEGEATVVDNRTRMFGPKDVGNVTYRVFVRKLAPNAHGWALQAKTLGAEDSTYVRVAGGAVQQREEGTRRGIVGINLNQLKTVDASHPGQGVLLAGYGTREGNKTLAFRLQEFTPDLGEHAAVTAAFVGHRRADTGGTGVRLAVHADLENVANNTDAKELVRLRARWLPGTGGRAATLATGGDIPEGEAYVGAACWNAQLEEGYKIVKHCTGIGTDARACTTVHEAGQLSNCRIQAREGDEPSLDPMDGALDEDAPDTEITAPDTEPTGESEVR